MSGAREWLAANERGVPARLVRHLHESVASDGDTVDGLLRSGETLLRAAIAADPMTRAQALDVLGADALVTCAFEAAADEPGRLAEQADAAMRRIAGIAEWIE